MSIDKALNEFMAENITALVELADRYGEDRDSVLERYAFLMSMVSEVATLASYGVEGGN